MKLLFVDWDVNQTRTIWSEYNIITSELLNSPQSSNTQIFQRGHHNLKWLKKHKKTLKVQGGGRFHFFIVFLKINPLFGLLWYLCDRNSSFCLPARGIYPFGSVGKSAGSYMNPIKSLGFNPRPGTILCYSIYLIPYNYNSWLPHKTNFEIPWLFPDLSLTKLWFSLMEIIKFLSPF